MYSEGRRESELAGRAGIGLACILGCIEIFKSMTDQMIVKTLFQTYDFFNFITQAKPGKSASKIIVKFLPTITTLPRMGLCGAAHNIQISEELLRDILFLISWYKKKNSRNYSLFLNPVLNGSLGTWL